MRYIRTQIRLTALGINKTHTYGRKLFGWMLDLHAECKSTHRILESIKKLFAGKNVYLLYKFRE